MELTCKVFRHSWTTGPLYRLVYSDPPEVHLHCDRCQEWVEVTEKQFKRYYSKESKKLIDKAGNSYNNDDDGYEYVEEE